VYIHSNPTLLFCECSKRDKTRVKSTAEREMRKKSQVAQIYVDFVNIMNEYFSAIKVRMRRIVCLFGVKSKFIYCTQLFSRVVFNISLYTSQFHVELFNYTVSIWERVKLNEHEWKIQCCCVRKNHRIACIIFSS
jgi:hypothetical protein